MARISLRSYNREIENLIERGQIEEAIAHSKNILKQYPKHIETYRLLGKAYLESQRYSEASDILQRVLSVIPDDFVAQLGMSIIREDEGSLDASIWHMERAYEVQPFNRAVQDELRRLYGRRDGAEPPRVRLTRGSLVRMYARGELYPQAIAEIRAALAEDPHRIDLNVLLARMYFQAGQKVESAEIASNLIRKLPYCFEANRILMDILPGTNRAEEARNFQRRVYELDPYFEFITPNTPTSPQVPEQSVVVEHVDWRPSAQDNNQSPDWTRTIGVSWEKATQEEELPDWLDNLTASPSAAPISTTPPPPAAPSQIRSEEMVPDFLRNAGWDVSAPDSAENNLPVNFEEETPEALEKTEIPNWLQSMAPAEDTSPIESESGNLDWLAAILPGNASSNTLVDASQPEPAVQATQPDDTSLDWLSFAEEQDKSSSTIVPSESDSFSGASQPAAEGSTAQNTAQPETEAIPGWLNDFGSETAADQAITTQNVGDIPAWLQETTGPEEPASPESLSLLQESRSLEGAKATGELPAWMQDQSSGQQPSTDDIPDWLREDSASTETRLDVNAADSTNPPASSAASSEMPPAWIETPDDALASWLSQLNSTDTATALPAETQQSTNAEMLPDETAAEPLSMETKTAQIESVPADTSISPQGLESSPPAAIPDFSDMDAAMAWMEALAAKQGADADSLKISSPDQRSDAVPQWIAGLSQEETSAPAETTQNPVEVNATVPDEPEPIIPDALGKDLAESSVTTNAEIAQKAETPAPESGQLDVLPDWLNQAGQDDISQTAQTAILPTETSIEDTQPTKVRRNAEPAAPAEQPVEINVQPPAELTSPDFNDMDATMAWLEALAARQGAEPESLKITPPEQRNVTPPGWIAEITNQQTAAPIEETSLEAGIPDWLKDDGPGVVEPPIALPPIQNSSDWVSEFPGAVDEILPADQPASTPAPETHGNEPVPSQAEDSPAIGLPAWLIEEQTAPKPETPIISTQPGSTIPNLDDMDSTMAWLEALAAKQGADAASLKITSPAERSTTPPDWIAELSKQNNSSLVTDENSSLPDAPVEQVSAQPKPEGISPPEASPQLEIDPIKTPKEDVPALSEAPVVDPDIPDWLLNYEQDQAETKTGWETTISSDAIASKSAADEDESITRWLQTHHPVSGLEPAESADTPNPEPVQQAYPVDRQEDSLPAQAKAALSQGEITQAMSVYDQMIQSGGGLDNVIDELLNAADRYPVDANIWQTLGDAYIRADKIQDALNAYTRAEELLS